MTPLARKVMNYTSGELADKLVDAVCFECSGDILQAAADISPCVLDPDGSEEIAEAAFLPFPITWLEFKTLGAGRVGWLLEQVGGEIFATLVETNSGLVRYDKPFSIPSGGAGCLWSDMLVAAASADRNKFTACQLIYGLLALINTPRCINKQANTPHRGFEKNLKSKHGRPIKLNDWHVVTLRAPKEIEDAVNSGATGVVRALHRVRAHRRKLPSGKSTVVISHLRGDASLGFSPSTYRVLH